MKLKYSDKFNVSEKLFKIYERYSKIYKKL